MGNFGSRTFTDLVEEVEEQDTWEESPNTPTCLRVIAPDWDPRSPSNQIPRTPIQLPEGLEIDDPRSPTIGIARTPILPKPSASPTHQEEEIEEEVKLSVERQTPTPPSSSEEDIEGATSADIEGATGADIEGATSEVEESPDVPSTCLEDSSIEEQVSELASLVRVEPKSEEPTISPQREKKASKIPRKKQPRELFPIFTDKTSHQKSPVKSSQRSPRSPIAQRNVNIDVNAPRNIVKRNQVSRMLKGHGDTNMQMKVMLRGSPNKYQVMHDKEN